MPLPLRSEATSRDGVGTHRPQQPFSAMGVSMTDAKAHGEPVPQTRNVAALNRGIGMGSWTRKGAKAPAALIGGAALIVLGLSAVAQDRATPAAVTASGMTLGQTTTVPTQHASVASTMVVVPVARPAVKASRPKGF